VVRDIAAVAADLGLERDEWDGWGPQRAKLTLAAALRPRKRAGEPKLVLVSAMTPTPAGEGKTTTSIGLVQGLHATGRNAVVCLREPSLGPVFGSKGGGTGGGQSRLHPADAIDLHFTGDLHAITSANNLLAAMVDNHLHQGASPVLHPARVVWRRVMDMNDRALREVVTGLGQGNGVVREAGFDITAASEVMAALCLATGEEDLRERLARMVVGFDTEGNAITAKDLGASGPMMAILHEALRPNLVQTMEGVPALVHGGPFANIAHGCSSALATRAGLGRADYVVTEAGFAFDLGGEKFLDIKCRQLGLAPAVVVVVATVRALRFHGGASDFAQPDAGAVERGLLNLAKHVENVRTFGLRPLVALNRRVGDEQAEIALVQRWGAEAGVPVVEADPFGSGGPGCTALADAVVEVASGPPTPVRFLYDLDSPVPDKIEAIAKAMYGAKGITLSKRARSDLQRIRKLGLTGLPVCVAKTQSSLSDDPSLRGRPQGFSVTVQEVRLNAGAGFLVVLLGDIMRMPGLPARPNALDINVVDGKIVGLR
jgi:formate--tetrahydrofolate ligase